MLDWLRIQATQPVDHNEEIITNLSSRWRPSGVRQLRLSVNWEQTLSGFAAHSSYCVGGGHVSGVLRIFILTKIPMISVTVIISIFQMRKLRQREFGSLPF